MTAILAAASDTETNERYRVYVAGPLTIGDSFSHVRVALDLADDLWAWGFSPFVPHMNYVWHFVYPKNPQEWLEYDYGWLRLCDFLVRLPGESVGADAEVEEAKRLGIPVILEDYSDNLEAKLHELVKAKEAPVWGKKEKLSLMLYLQQKFEFVSL